MLYYNSLQEVYQEVPGEISLAIGVSGCPLNCKGCHSAFTHNKKLGEKLTEEVLERVFQRHKYLTTVLFYGGEWQILELIVLIDFIKRKGLKVALYTGYDFTFFNQAFLKKIDFIKTGAWKEDLGGLNSKTTNQRFYSLNEGKISKEIFFY